MEYKIFMNINKMLTSTGILLIRFYKFSISPYLPKSCRHQPTCSLYALEALEKYGFFKGIYLTLNRLLRCNPFGTRGFDPLL